MTEPVDQLEEAALRIARAARRLSVIRRYGVSERDIAAAQEALAGRLTDFEALVSANRRSGNPW